VNEYAIVKCVLLQVIYFWYIKVNYITFSSSLLQIMVDAVLKLSSMADMTAQVQCNSEHSTTARKVRTLQLQPGAAHAHQTTPVSVESTWAESWACHVARCQCLVSVGYAVSGLWWMPCHRFSGYFDEATTRPGDDGAKGTQ
jgi:hypothetical protein